MGLTPFLCALLCAGVLTVSSVFADDDSGDGFGWLRQRLPELAVRHTLPLSPPLFRGQEETEDSRGTKVICGIECQSSQPLLDQSEQAKILGYETLYENGTRTHTDVSLQATNKTSARRAAVHSSSVARRKRQVFGADGRFVISDSHFVTNYPFSTAVRLSMGCSGVLVSPKHVLTAAHCLHDGRDYLGSTRRLKVGVLQLKSKRKQGGRRREGRNRGGRKSKELVTEEDENMNNIDMKRGRKGDRSKRAQKQGDGRITDGGSKAKRGHKQKKSSRIRRSSGLRKQPVFRWTQVKRTHIPQGWIQTETSTKSVSPDYDYALLELKRPVKQKHMELGVASSAIPHARIHFSGYDSDKSQQPHEGPDEKVIYRFCSVEKESDDLLYQHCDAQPGATGAGVYIRLRQEGEKGKWRRKVIGVFSGHQWVEVGGGEQRDFNVAVRITPPKYAQICHWIHGDPSLCKEV